MVLEIFSFKNEYTVGILSQIIFLQIKPEGVNFFHITGSWIVQKDHGDDFYLFKV